MKASFYGHFVAGEDVARIRPLVHRNMSFGVRSILDYSVEKDISREEARAAELAYVIFLTSFYTPWARSQRLQMLLLLLLLFLLLSDFQFPKTSSFHIRS